MEKIQRGCIAKLEKVVNKNVDIRSLSEYDPFHCTMPKNSVTRARVDGAWRISDEDHAFLMDEARVWEEHNEYDVELANEVLQQQREDEKWKNTDINEDEDDKESHW